MPFAYSKLHGVPADRLLAAIEPILAAHGLEGVELIWKTDNRGWLLYVTVERSSEMTSSESGVGVTLDDCSELSRDLSAALDVDDIIPGAYRLEVGTPGIERRLYSTADFERFKSKLAKVKLHRPLAGEYTYRGYILGVESGEPSSVLLGKEPDTSQEAAWRFEFDNISTANLVLEWGSDARPKVGKAANPKGGKATHPKRTAAGDAPQGTVQGRPNSGVTASVLTVEVLPAEEHTAEEDDYSDELGSDEFGDDAEFDSAASVATTQVKHGS
jgi:ribosome maturation factor RimP